MFAIIQQANITFHGKVADFILSITSTKLCRLCSCSCCNLSSLYGVSSMVGSLSLASFYKTKIRFVKIEVVFQKPSSVYRQKLTVHGEQR